MSVFPSILVFCRSKFDHLKMLSDIINDNIDLNRVKAFRFEVIYLICFDDNLTNFYDVIFRRDQSGDGSASACVNFANILRTAFTHVDPKSVKRYWQVDLVLTFWGAMGAKTSRKYVDEIDPLCQFHQHFKHSFYACRSQKRKNTDKPTVFFYSGICGHKSSS